MNLWVESNLLMEMPELKGKAYFVSKKEHNFKFQNNVKF